jgi:hypothetical protein
LPQSHASVSLKPRKPRAALTAYCHVVKDRRPKTYNISIPDLDEKAIQDWIAGHGFPRFKRLRTRLTPVLRVRVVASVDQQVFHPIVDRRKSLHWRADLKRRITFAHSPWLV